uniref:Uncharacterized protein n=1 Tax=Triticum urartu TaxID=4572 RepID=A0A8R7Q370_TRIUA
MQTTVLHSVIIRVKKKKSAPTCGPESREPDHRSLWRLGPSSLAVHLLDRRGQATCGPPVGESEGVDNPWRQWRRRSRRRCGWRWRRWRRCTEKTAACTATSLPTLSSTFAPTLPTTPRSSSWNSFLELKHPPSIQKNHLMFMLWKVRASMRIDRHILLAVSKTRQKSFPTTQCL